jgi:hypothetical protein
MLRRAPRRICFSVRAARRHSSSNNLTSTDYGTALNQALQTCTTNRQNTLNQIAGYQNLVGTGLSATNTGNTDIGSTASQINSNNSQIAANNIAAGTYQGNTGLQATQIQAQALTGAANASAAGTIGAANAATGALNGVANNASMAALYGGTGPGLNPYGTMSVGNLHIPLNSSGTIGPNPNTGVSFSPNGTMTVHTGGTGGSSSGNSLGGT